MKYVLTAETIKHKGVILHRIKAITSFRDVMAGDLGGFVESEKNLSQAKRCWIYDNAKVYGKATVTSSARVKDNADVSGEAAIRDSSKVLDNAVITDQAVIKNSTIVMEDARVSGKVKLSGNSVARGDVNLYSDYRKEYFSKVIGTEKYPLSNLVKDFIEKDEEPKQTFAINPNRDIIKEYKQTIFSLLKFVDKLKGERDYIRKYHEEFYNQIEKLI